MRTGTSSARASGPLRAPVWPAVLAAATAVVLVSGCGGVTGVAQPVGAPAAVSSVDVPPPSAPAGVGGAPQLTGGGPAVVIDANPATVGGKQRGYTITVFADGQVQRPTADGIGMEKFSVPVGQVQQLVDLAYRGGLFDSPEPTIRISDVGSTTLRLSVGGRDAEVTVDGTGAAALTDSDPVSGAVVAIERAVAGWKPSKAAQISYPDSLMVQASATTSRPRSAAAAWPLPTAPQKLFAERSCAKLTGADIAALAKLVRSREDVSTVVPTSDPAMPFVELNWGRLDLICSGRTKQPPAVDPYGAGYHPNQITGLSGEHRPADAWDRLVAAAVLDARLERLSVYTASAGGTAVLDVSLSAGASSGSTGREFRIERSTGKVLAERPGR
ncbi:hypothetical protein [Nakamurella aerolata]|uniref:Uncharacterized protein n=1 Tax=Nakamurella aerolata TaxID=1656892 RepID=A0A849A9L0_9ACTN|nr:hypothetical protein [Nakamurella aerolata]NNG35788.1 hypothetical protein [Nakamurella aerolata]